MRGLLKSSQIPFGAIHPRLEAIQIALNHGKAHLHGLESESSQDDLALIRNDLSRLEARMKSPWIPLAEFDSPS